MKTDAYLIPLQNGVADQTLEIELSGNPYILRVLWNVNYEYWSLSIFTVDNEPILQNIKLVKNFNVLVDFKDLRLPPGGIYLLQERGNTTRPQFDELGTTHNLYYVEDLEIAI